MTTMTKNRYTYYSYEEWGRGYIGKRSCDCLPEEDVEYFGTFSDKTFKPKHKIILRSDYENAEELAKDEIILHDFYDVAKNPHFANRAKATSTSFDTTGTTHTDEAKQLIREALAGEKHPMYGKTGEKNPNYGKTHTDETKQLLSELNTGEKNPMYGKTGEKNHMYGKTGEKHPMFGKTYVHTEETKQLIREAKTGEKNRNFGSNWYVNSAGETRMCKEPPGPGWQQGRKWREPK